MISRQVFALNKKSGEEKKFPFILFSHLVLWKQQKDLAIRFGIAYWVTYYQRDVWICNRLLKKLIIISPVLTYKTCTWRKGISRQGITYSITMKHSTTVLRASLNCVSNTKRKSYCLLPKRHSATNKLSSLSLLSIAFSSLSLSLSLFFHVSMCFSLSPH